LTAITNSNIILFNDHNIPEGVIERLDGKKVVVIGEYHGVQEHIDLVTDLALALHEQSHFSQLLIELSHALGWMVEDYVSGLSDDILPFLIQNQQVDLARIRHYNLKLPSEKRIKVHAVDINHNPSFIRASLLSLLEYNTLEYTEILENFIRQFDNIENIMTDSELFYGLIEALHSDLISERLYLAEAWGETWFNRLVDIAEMELASILCRRPLEQGDVELRSKMREDTIKSMVDGYMENGEGGTLVNIGFYHAQNSHFLGTQNEWLGEYLRSSSPHSKGESYSLVVVPAKGEIKWGDSYRNIDIAAGRRKNELFSTMYRLSSGNTAFLSLDDDIFQNELIHLNYHYELLEINPKRQFDGYILLPKVTLKGR